MERQHHQKQIANKSGISSGAKYQDEVEEESAEYQTNHDFLLKVDEGEGEEDSQYNEVYVWGDDSLGQLGLCG